MLADPADVSRRAPTPIPVLSVPRESDWSAPEPIAIFAVPVREAVILAVPKAKLFANTWSK